MITGIHGMYFSEEADALRAFLRDKLQIPARDVGGGWLVFDLPMADMGVHPTDHEGAPASGTHDVSFICDDIDKTVAEMKARGVEFDDEIKDQGYGLTIHFRMPGGVRVEMFQKRY